MTATAAPSDLPPAQRYEIAIARKMKEKQLSKDRIFRQFDCDNDGRISKSDFRNTLQFLFKMELSDEQADHIFKRSSYFAPSSVKESRLNDSSPDSQDYEKMGFQEFSKYVETTAFAMVSTPPINTDTPHIASPSPIPNHSTPLRRKIVEDKATQLKRKVIEKIQQIVPGDLSTEEGNTLSFLQMDTSKDNQVTGKEFEDWLRIRNKLDFSDEEMTLIRGEWRKEEALSLQEFNSFLKCMNYECMEDDSSIEIFEKLTENQNPLQEIENGDSKRDDALIWSFLNYFRGKNKTFTQAFDILDVTHSKALSAQDVQRGLKHSGVILSIERIRQLTKKYVDVGGRMSRPGFVRMMTSISKSSGRV